MKKYILTLLTIFLVSCSTIEQTAEFQSTEDVSIEISRTELKLKFLEYKVKARTVVAGGLNKTIEVYLSDSNNTEINYQAFNFRLIYLGTTLDCLGASQCRFSIASAPDNAMDPEDSNDLEIFIDIKGFNDAVLTKREQFSVPNKMIFYYNWVIKRDRVVAFSRPQLSSVIKDLVFTKGYSFKYVKPSNDVSFVELDYSQDHRGTIWLPRTSIELVRAK